MGDKPTPGPVRGRWLPVYLRAAIPALLISVLVAAGWPRMDVAETTPAAEFMPFAAAKPVLDKMASALPAALKEAHPLDANAWNGWLRSEDAEIRKRLERGEEDTLTNLLRFGVTYTKEYRIDREYLARYGQSTLVNAFAENRANDLIRALRSASANAGMKEMRAFLQRKGFSFNTPAERARVKKYLLDNLARMRDEFLAYREKIKTASPAELSELYAGRGISLDTNLWPDYDLDQELERLIHTGVLKAGSVRRVAVVGPGLDFTNKEAGNDYYPPQTTQPFALVDSLLRLKVAEVSSVRLYTLDISPLVNIHVQRIHRAALAGEPYTVQLTWDTTVPRTADYLAGFERYVQGWGGQIGTAVPPIPPPAATAAELKVRAVKIRPDIVARVSPIDMNIVLQRVSVPQDQRFDLIIGTNVFVYYGPFEQSLARANLAAMLKPGGLVLTNEMLADAVPSKLPELTRTNTVISADPLITQTIFCYRREPLP